MRNSQINQRIRTRRKVTVRMHVETLLTTVLSIVAAFGLGIIFTSTFLFTDAEFWSNVEKLWK